VSLPVKVGADVKADLSGLDATLLAEAFGHMASLKDKPLLGQPLGDHPDVGDLSDCRKIYFDKARRRVIYRVVPDETDPKAVEIIVVGRRADFRVYYDAVRRLGRTPGVDAPQK